MSKRAYGQYCGFARALDIVGERWALMIVRDLLVEPKRFGQLHAGLAGIPTNILTTRLKELEASGIVRRRVLPRPSGAVVYELTGDGRALQPAIDALGVWGSKRLGEPHPGEIVTPESMVTALRTTFVPDAARGVRATFELHMAGFTIHARVDDATLAAAPGALPGADLRIEAGPALRAVMARKTSVRQALASGAIRIAGKRALLDLFVKLFRV